MCGEASSGSMDLLPIWMTDCATKGVSESYKVTIIRKWIMSNEFYDDAEVPLTANILKMALKRSWTGKDGNIMRPSLINAIEGLSPFAIVRPQ